MDYHTMGDGESEGAFYMVIIAFMVVVFVCVADPVLAYYLSKKEIAKEPQLNVNGYTVLISLAVFIWLIVEGFLRYGILNEIGVKWSGGGFSKVEIIMFIATVLLQLAAVIMVLFIKKTEHNK